MLGTPNNNKIVIVDVFMSGEEIKLTPSPKTKALYFLYCLLLSLIPLIISLLCLIQGLLHIGLLLLSLTIFILILFMYIIEKYVSSISYMFTDTHIYRRLDAFELIEERLPYTQITSVKVKQNPLQKILKLATIEIYSHDMSKPALTISNIDYNNLMEILVKIQNKWKTQ